MDGEWAREPTLVKRTNGDRYKLKQLLVESVEKRVKGLREAALLFSGGVDSALLALLLKDKVDLHCYCAGTKQSHDWEHSVASAKTLGLELTRVKFGLEEVRSALPEIKKAINSDNVMKLGVSVPLWMCCREANEKAVFFGMGTEELFAGYDRHRKLLPDYDAIQEECWKGVLGAWDRDLSRDIGICKALGKQGFFPYLDQKFVEEAMALPAEEKINEEINKLVLREMAVELGLPKEIAFHPKKAAQYGSHSDKLIRKLAKESGESVQDYLAKL